MVGDGLHAGQSSLLTGGFHHKLRGQIGRFAFKVLLPRRRFKSRQPIRPGINAFKPLFHEFVECLRHIAVAGFPLPAPLLKLNGEIGTLRSVLTARGFRVEEGSGTLRIRRAAATAPKPPAAPPSNDQ